MQILCNLQPFYAICSLFYSFYNESSFNNQDTFWWVCKIKMKAEKEVVIGEKYKIESTEVSSTFEGLIANFYSPVERNSKVK